mgnify:CR=1 FL=1
MENTQGTEQVKIEDIFTKEQLEENLKYLKQMTEMRLMYENHLKKLEEKEAKKAAYNPVASEEYMYEAPQVAGQGDAFRYGEMRHDVYRSLFDKRPDAYKIINKLILPISKERIDWNIIEETLVRNTKSVIQSFIQRETSIDPSSYMYVTKEQLMDLKYQMSKIYDNMDDLTYLIISCTANFILSQMLFYIDRSHMFTYIKENILRPNARIFIEHAKKNLIDQDLAETVEDTQAQLIDDVREYIYAMLISCDNDKATLMRNKLCDYRQRFYSKLEGEFLAGSEYLIPEFVKDLVLFKDNNTEVLALKDYLEFRDKYLISLTVNGNRELFRKYCDPDIIDDEFNMKLKHTIEKRNNENGIYLKQDQLLDGITFEEMRMISRACTGRLEHEDREKLNGTKYAKRVFEIIDRFGGLHINWYLKEGKLWMRSTYDGSERSFDVRTDKFDVDINPILDRFPEFIKNSLYNDPSMENLPECSLFASGYVVNPMTDPEEVRAMIGNYKRMSRNDRINHRLDIIQRYIRANKAMNRDRVDFLQNLMQNYEEFGAGGKIGDNILYEGNEPIICNNMEELIEKLTTIEGVWRMLCIAEKTRKERLARLYLEDAIMEQDIPINSKYYKPVKPKPVPGAEKKYEYDEDDIKRMQNGLPPKNIKLEFIPTSKQERDRLLDHHLYYAQKQKGTIFDKNGKLLPELHFITNFYHDGFFDNMKSGNNRDDDSLY